MGWILNPTLLKKSKSDRKQVQKQRNIREENNKNNDQRELKDSKGTGKAREAKFTFGHRDVLGLAP